MQAILHLAILSVTIIALARLNPSVHVKSVGTAVAVAIVFSLLNLALGWLIRAVLFVPALFTLGVLFLFVPFIVNAVLLFITDKVMAGFRIDSMRGLLVSALVITAVNAILHATWFSTSVDHVRWI